MSESGPNGERGTQYETWDGNRRCPECLVWGWRKGYGCTSCGKMLDKAKDCFCDTLPPGRRWDSARCDKHKVGKDHV